MKITETRIKVYENNNTKGFATVTFDDVLVVSGLAIIQGKNGLFVSMPQSKGSDGKYHDSVFPLNKSGREYINDTVLEAYNKALEEEKPVEKKNSKKGL